MSKGLASASDIVVVRLVGGSGGVPPVPDTPELNGPTKRLAGLGPSAATLYSYVTPALAPLSVYADVEPEFAYGVVKVSR